MLRLPSHEQPHLRHLLLGGDVLRTRPRPEAPYETVNVYGPTETTVLCTTETVAAHSDDPARPIAIGRPADNVRLSVLDESGSPVPVGTVGSCTSADRAWPSATPTAPNSPPSGSCRTRTAARTRAGTAPAIWSAGPATGRWSSAAGPTTR
ncbi:AMP-binding protein [Streptomyces sp. MS1.AVA.1]|uniref:AMP-binding protein n=1 Tax=Streptomyces machairae TaxID=3134109 RepID=A0ABU8UU70_9ACTN